MKQHKQLLHFSNIQQSKRIYIHKETREGSYIATNKLQCFLMDPSIRFLCKTFIYFYIWYLLWRFLVVLLIVVQVAVVVVYGSISSSCVSRCCVSSSCCYVSISCGYGSIGCSRLVVIVFVIFNWLIVSFCCNCAGLHNSNFHRRNLGNILCFL